MAFTLWQLILQRSASAFPLLQTSWGPALCSVPACRRSKCTAAWARAAPTCAPLTVRPLRFWKWRGRAHARPAQPGPSPMPYLLCTACVRVCSHRHPPGEGCNVLARVVAKGVLLRRQDSWKCCCLSCPGAPSTRLRAAEAAEAEVGTGKGVGGILKKASSSAACGSAQPG